MNFGDLTPSLTYGNKTQKREMTELAHLPEPHFCALFIENPIYAFPEKKLPGLVPNSYIHVVCE